MIKTVFLIVFFAWIQIAGLALAAQESPPAPPEDWTIMPAGAKQSYMGIHGGTMPVSLLVSGDGSALFSFVGRTGDDFLNALRGAHLPLPSFGNSTKPAHPALAGGAASLFAGNATSTLPVFSISGGSLARAETINQLAPFGLSSQPLSIEGSVVKPESFPHARAIRPFRLPDYFQPRRPR